MALLAKDVAASAVSVIPFHCVICFDEFNLKENIPVVLPCGHTFVCLACSKRLKKCMECREPLFLNATTKKNLSETGTVHSPFSRTTPSRMTGRVTRLSPESPVRRKTPTGDIIPLPISKNVLMIAMLEAAEQTKKQQEVIENFEKDTEVNRILDGIEAIAGPCGTYAVKEDDGLVVLPTDPRIRNHRRIPAPNICREPFNVEKGQMVQIVEYDDGVYKLARNDGYIVAGSSQLVKVNGPLESSCRLEGMYNIVEARKQELRKRLEQIERLSDGLAQRIQCVRKEVPSYPVITDSSSKDETLNNRAKLKKLDCDRSEGSNITKKIIIESPLKEQRKESPTTKFSNAVRKFELLGTPKKGISSSGHSKSLPTTPNTIDNSDIKGYIDENSFPEQHNAAPYMCSTLQFFSKKNEDVATSNLSNNRSFESFPQTNPRHLQRNVATDFPSFNNLSGTSEHNKRAVGSVNFSTGMSGHGALTSSRNCSSAGKLIAPRQVRIMGAHAGLSLQKRKKRHRNFYSPPC